MGTQVNNLREKQALQAAKDYIDSRATAQVVKTSVSLYKATDNSTPNALTLNQPIDDFDAVQVVLRGDTNIYMEYIIDKADLIYNTTQVGFDIGNNYYVWYNIASPTTLTKAYGEHRGYIGEVKGINYSPKENYTTNEQIVGTWIDGRPLYQRVLVVPATNFPLKTNTWTKIAFNDPALNNISIKTGIFLNANGQIDVAVLPSNDGGLSYYSDAAYGSQGNGEIIIKYIKP